MVANGQDSVDVIDPEKAGVEMFATPMVFAVVALTERQLPDPADALEVRGAYRILAMLEEDPPLLCLYASHLSLPRLLSNLFAELNAAHQLDRAGHGDTSLGTYETSTTNATLATSEFGAVTKLALARPAIAAVDFAKNSVRAAVAHQQALARLQTVIERMPTAVSGSQ